MAALGDRRPVADTQRRHTSSNNLFQSSNPHLADFFHFAPAERVRTCATSCSVSQEKPNNRLRSRERDKRPIFALVRQADYSATERYDGCLGKIRRPTIQHLLRRVSEREPDEE